MNSAHDDVLSQLRRKIAAMEGTSPSLQDSTPSQSRMRRGAESCQSKASDVEPSDDLAKAKRKIERLANIREHCSSQMEARLIRDGFSPETSQEAVQWALRCGLIDDWRYADILVRSRMAAGKGLAGIERELSQAGIDPQSVELLQEQLLSGHDAEVERALALLERKPPRAKNARDAAYRRLAQKGFSSSVASSAARIWWEGQRTDLS